MTSPRSSSSPLRSSLASGVRACDEGNHHGDVPHVCACDPERLVMPQPCLSHPVRLEPPCASPRLLRWPPAAARARQLRWTRLLRVGVAGLGRLAGPVAEELEYSKVVEWSTGADGPRSVDLQVVWRPLNEWLNVETMIECQTRVSPANDGCVYVPSALSLGFKLRLCRDRA